MSFLVVCQFDFHYHVREGRKGMKCARAEVHAGEKTDRLSILLFVKSRSQSLKKRN